MSKSSVKPTFLQMLQTAEPFLAADMKNEIKALDELMQTLQVDNVKDLARQIIKFRDKIRKSPEGFVERVQEYQNAVANSQTSEETVETLTNDFKKLSATNIKAIAKKLDVNLSNSKDAEVFAYWLETGVKPPTAEELLKQELSSYIEATIKLRDQSLQDLKEDVADAILEIAENVHKKHKLVGLKEYMIGLGLGPQGKTKASLIKQLKSHLANLALSRFKIHANFGQSQYLERL